MVLLEHENFGPPKLRCASIFVKIDIVNNETSPFVIKQIKFGNFNF